MIFGWLAGNINWVENNKLVEVRRDEEVGGKGGFMGGSQTVRTFDYFGNFSIKVAQADPEANSITRIWADRKIIFDRTGNSPSVMKYPSGDIRTYLGTSTQDPDPLIENEKGTDSTPAFRGSIYIVFEMLPLADFGNRIPQIEAEVQFSTGVTTSTDDLTSMTGWAVRNSQHMQNSFMLYFVRRHDAPGTDTVASIHRYDIYDDALEASTAASPYANELTIGASGIRPLVVLPGDDGKLLVLGRHISDGKRMLIELNPYTLQLLKVVDLTALIPLTAGNELEQACITWTYQGTQGVETFSMLFFDGEGGVIVDQVRERLGRVLRRLRNQLQRRAGSRRASRFGGEDQVCRLRSQRGPDPRHGAGQGGWHCASAREALGETSNACRCASSRLSTAAVPTAKWWRWQADSTPSPQGQMASPSHRPTLRQAMPCCSSTHTRRSSSAPKCRS